MCIRVQLEPENYHKNVNANHHCLCVRIQLGASVWLYYTAAGLTWPTRRNSIGKWSKCWKKTHSNVTMTWLLEEEAPWPSLPTHQLSDLNEVATITFTVNCSCFYRQTLCNNILSLFQLEQRKCVTAQHQFKSISSQPSGNAKRLKNILRYSEYLMICWGRKLVYNRNRLSNCMIIYMKQLYFNAH